MPSFAFYSDAGLTTTVGSTADFTQSVDGSTGAVVRTVYYGSTSVGRTLRAASDPGVDPIILSIVDSTPLAGSPVGDVTLALEETFYGRAPGAALSLGTQILGGVANAVPIYIRVLDTTETLGLNTDLSLAMVECEES